MADPRFFDRQGPFTLAELAGRSATTLRPADAGGRAARDVAPLDRAGPDEVSFFDNRRYRDAFIRTRAGACVVAEADAADAPPGLALFIAAQPYLAYAAIAHAFYPAERPVAGIHPKAVIDPTAKLGAAVAVAAGAVIEAGVEIGAGTAIGANATIGRNVRIGRDCRVGALASLSHCEIGDSVTLHPGVRIGQDGFGFAPDPRGHVKVPQLGRVLIGDNCDIGANTAIDRGSGPDTVIGPGCWIDNLVQIGHNVTIGRGSIVVAQVGISGSTHVGDFVALGGQAGLIGHLTIGAGARIAAQSGVMNDVPAGATWFGSPAAPVKEAFRQIAVVKRLARSKGTDQ